MLTSKNPNGEIEAYTDIGQFIGILPPNHPLADDYAEDGGPGSGNFGHKGRPGKVGGSGPGGGKQYRGGRADIGYFGSRKDWLNGLSGEEQSNASRFVENARLELNEAIKAKKNIESLRGKIPDDLVQERLKKENLEKLKDDFTPEEYIMNCGSPTQKNNLMVHVGKARGWPDTADKLIKYNLDETEQKVINWIRENVDDFNRFPSSYDETYNNLKAKACGVPHSDEPIPDELLYASGVKKGSNKLDWFTSPKDRGWGSGKYLERYMADVIGDNKDSFEYRQRLENLTKPEFEALTQKFLDTIKYKDMTAKEVDGLRYAIREMQAASGKNEFGESDLKSLSEEDQNRLKEVCKIFYDPLGEDINFDTIQRNISWSPLRKKAERRAAQDFFEIKAKIITGMEPLSEEKSEVYKALKNEKEKKKEEKKNAKKVAEERAKRDKMLEEEEEKRREAGISTGNPMVGYEKDSSTLNREHLDDVINGVNPFYTESRNLKDKRYYWNCQRCVVAFVARLRGYKVEAKPKMSVGRSAADPFFKDGGIKKFFSGAPEDHVSGRTAEDQKNTIEQSLKDWGDGSVAILSVAWARRNSAHAFIAMNDNGVIKYIDPQNPSKDASKYIANGEIQPWYTKIIRADDRVFTHHIHQAVRPEGGQYYDRFD